jgi:hypothetical protein
MKQRKLKLYYFYLLFFLSWLLIGGECGTNNENYSFPPEPVAPPENIKLVVDAEPDGGESFAKISWTASLDESKNNFKGYRVTTYVLNSSDQVIYIFEVDSVDKFINSYIVNNINRNVRYKSVILAELTDGSQSAFRETYIYCGVYYNNDGSINSHVDENSISGYGWDIQSGNGNQYLYIENNSSLIDLHLRETSGTLLFYSPNVFQNNFKSSKIDLVGSGQDAFDKTDLSEPEKTNIAVEDESVYLLKTSEGYYIKIWVKNIGSIQNYFNVKFEYKVQPMKGLRILKR